MLIWFKKLLETAALPIEAINYRKKHSNSSKKYRKYVPIITSDNFCLFLLYANVLINFVIKSAYLPKTSGICGGSK